MVQFSNMVQYVKFSSVLFICVIITKLQKIYPVINESINL